MCCFDAKEELDAAVDYHRAELPSRIRELIDRLNNDLYSGPSYYDAKDEKCSCFDEGATPFAFSEALREVRDYFNNIDDVKVGCVNLDEDGNEVTWDERIDDSARYIARAICGNELASMF